MTTTPANQPSAANPTDSTSLANLVAAPTQGVVYWARADLRWHDNPAFSFAYSHAKQLGVDLQVVYIHSPLQWQQHGYGARRMGLEQQAAEAFLASMASMASTEGSAGAQLSASPLSDSGQVDTQAHKQIRKQIHIKVHQLHSPSFNTLPADLVDMCISHGITQLYANRQYEYNEVARDRAVHSLAKQHAISCHWLEDQCIIPPAQALKPTSKASSKAATTSTTDAYKVFTAYKNRVLAMLNQQPSVCLPAPAAHVTVNSPEQRALDTLQRYVTSAQAANYNQLRNYPALAATSQLSAYLAVGLITTRQCLVAWLQAGHPLASQWVAELLWRDYYRYVMCHFAHVGQGRNFVNFAQPIAWHNSPTDFAAWCEGRTGYPIVDAAMRCLNATGFMHNRLRMVVAMFLCKHLRVDWRWGERYFLQQLVDADYASNNGGWQWCAGTGVDAAPYFRIFNPTTQSEKFDADGVFIRQWVPQLAHLSNKAIHAPQAAGVRPPDYPAPIVDHSAARAACLAMYKQAKGSAEAS